ncbi:MAG: zinc-dependent metalloprotease, partial [Acidobacteriota bacterium]
VIKDTEKIEGLFTFYMKKDDGKVFLEILPDQMDKVFLLSPTLEGGIGENFIYAAWVLGEYPIKFQKVGKNIQFRIPNIWFRADSSPEMQRALTRSFSDSLLAQTKVASQPHPERDSILVSLNDLLINDLEGLQIFLKQVYKTGYSLDKEASYFGTLKGFPKNVEIEMIQHYKTGEPKGSHTLPDSRSMFLTFRYSLSEIPDNGYRPRLADDRVGTFNTIFQDYSDDRRETAYIRYVQRWNLEKTDPSAALSPAKEPVVFWLENTIPVEYRDAVREGALLYNDAFERIGIQDAIVVKQQPDDADWDPADVRYNTIRWFIAPGATFAQGPSRANPFTGELYDADIRFSADMIRRTWRRHEEFINPVALMAPPMPAKLGHGIGPKSFCNHATGASLQAGFAMELMTARGIFSEGSAEAEKFVHDFLVEVTAHEVGHTIGMRHNFKASSIHANADLHNTELTSREGLGGSVMDYNPANVAANGAPQGQFWQTALGPYDYWAIEYAYKPIDASSPEEELEELDRIASRASQPELAYLTDEDTFGFATRAIDPTSSLWDMGDDPIEFNRGQVALAHELWERMDAHFDQPGERYQKYRNAISFGVINVWIAAQNVPKYIGGIYNNRDHIGDPGGRLPFEPVPAWTPPGRGSDSRSAVSARGYHESPTSSRAPACSAVREETRTHRPPGSPRGRTP